MQPSDAQLIHRAQQIEAERTIWNRPPSLVSDEVTQAVVLSFDPANEDEAEALRARVERLREARG